MNSTLLRNSMGGGAILGRSLYAVSTICGALTFGGCDHTAPDTSFLGRELRPPRASIQVGALYFAREPAGTSANTPVNLERLCDIAIEKYQVVPEKTEIADIDLSSSIEAAAAAEGIKNYFFDLGLSGKISDYFEYKLTNVTQVSITWVEAKKIFDNRAFQKDCAGWRANLGDDAFAKYQILSLRKGDIIFKQKDNVGLSADLSAKISVAEPKLKATLKRDHNLLMSGKGLVFSFSPIHRS